MIFSSFQLTPLPAILRSARRHSPVIGVRMKLLIPISLVLVLIACQLWRRGERVCSPQELRRVAWPCQ